MRRQFVVVDMTDNVAKGVARNPAFAGARPRPSK